MAKTTVRATHTWADGASVEIVIRTPVYPDSLETLETLEDVCKRATEALAAELRDCTEDPAEIEP